MKIRTILLLAAMPLLALVANNAHAADPLDPLQPILEPLAYQIHAEYKTPSGDILTTDAAAIQGIPSLLDVDHGAEPIPDVLVQMTIDAGRATLRVTRLPIVGPDPMPLKVLVTLPDPRKELPLPLLGTPDDKLRVSFGYDALNATNAPQTYDATLAIAGASRITSFTLDLHTVLPGDTLGVIGEVYTLGDNGEHLDPLKGRIDYIPVPAVAHFGVLSGSDIGLGAGQSSIDLETDLPTKGTIVIEDIQGNHETRIDGIVDQIPNTLSLVFTGVADTGQQTWTYTASARVALISLHEVETRDTTTLQDSLLQLEDMSLGATLVQDAPNHSTFTSESAIGVVKVGLAKGGAAHFLDDDQYLHAYKDATVDSLAFQVKQLESAEVGSGDPFVIGATLKAGPFHLLQIDGDATTEAWLRNLPHTVRISGSPSQGTISYSGSARMDELTMDVHDPAGIGGRATDLHLLLQGIPGAVDVDFGQDSSTVSLDANGEVIDLLELQLTDGPDDRLDPAVDGILLEDLADRYVVFARITGLRKVVAGQGDELVLTLDTVGGRVFKVDFEQLNEQAHLTFVHATLDHLVPSIEVHFNAGAGTISYTGSDVMNTITFDASDPDGLSGRATEAHLLLRDIPTSLSLTFGQGGSSATIDAGGSTLGLFQVQLSDGHDDQLDPDADGIMVEDLTDRYVVFARVTGLRKIVVDQGPPPSLDIETTGGRLFIVDLRQDKPSGRASTNATIVNLVPVVSIDFTSPTTFAYAASDPVGVITIDAVDPDGIAGRATEVHANLQQLPHAFDVGFAADGTVTLNAQGETLGLIEFQLTSGPDDRIDSAFDGMMLEDLADRYVVFARMTQLRSASAKAPNFTIDSTGGRIFKIDTEQLIGAKIQYLRGTLDHLVPNLSITLVDIPTGAKTIYNASQTTNSLTLDSNAGNRWNLHTDIRPLPVHLDFCAASDGACTGATAANRRFAPNAGSQAIHASEPIVVNVFDCVAPATNCDAGNATKFTNVSNFHVRTFEFDAGSSSSQSDGYIFENTTNHDTGQGCAASPQASDTGACHYRATGSITNRDTGAGSGFQEVMGTNFWADNRFGGWCFFLFSCNKSNYISCDGTSLSVWVFNIKLGVSSFLC